jgi:hypothetical protein
LPSECAWGVFALRPKGARPAPEHALIKPLLGSFVTGQVLGVDGGLGSLKAQ